LHPLELAQGHVELGASEGRRADHQVQARRAADLVGSPREAVLLAGQVAGLARRGQDSLGRGAHPLRVTRFEGTRPTRGLYAHLGLGHGRGALAHQAIARAALPDGHREHGGDVPCCESADARIGRHRGKPAREIEAREIARAGLCLCRA